MRSVTGPSRPDFILLIISVVIFRFAGQEYKIVKMQEAAKQRWSPNWEPTDEPVVETIREIRKAQTDLARNGLLCNINL